MGKSASLIVTVKNEQNAIVKLLESIASQTRIPDEIIITDAGSTDKTKEKIKSFKKKLPQIKLISVPGKNRSIGRNTAISKSKSNIIAVTDSGCIPKPDWFEKIIHPIETKEAKSVAGYYLTECNSATECASAPFVAVMPDKIHPDYYLPSSRSVAFTKKAWKAAGKYPENVDFCEDLLFAKSLKEKTEMVVHPTAIVYWLHYKSISRFFKQIRNYSSGDIEARYWPHIFKIITVYLRYIIFFFIHPLFFLYLIWPIYKHHKYVRYPAGIILLPVFQVLTDLGIIVGSIKGTISK
ncbi:glycosyltransferase [Patescibacteria group bacterium]